MDAESVTRLLKHGNTAPIISQVQREFRPRAGLSQPPSVVRSAIAMLLQYPRLAQKLTDRELFERMELPGIPLLLSIMDILTTRPELNTAAILENFRDSEHLVHLEKLTAWRHPALEQDVEAEFEDSLLWIRKTAAKQRTEQLLHKQRLSGLSTAEKLELTNLLISKREFEEVEVRQ
jgi:DNA primase